MDQSINALVAVTRRLQELSRVLTELWRRRKTPRWRCARPFGRVGQRMHRAFGGMNGIGDKTSRTQLRIGQQIFGAVHRHVGHIGLVQQLTPLRGGARFHDAAHLLVHGVDVLCENGKDVLILGVGAMSAIALQVASLLEARGIRCTVIDPRWVVPVRKSVLQLASEHRLMVTIEDGVVVGGIGTRVRQDLRDAQIDTALTELGLPDEFLEHATRDQILERVGLTAEAIAQRIEAQVNGQRIPHARDAG